MPLPAMIRAFNSLRSLAKGNDMIHNDQGLVIQIKICAEYRDMLPRPKLVFQEAQVYLTNPADAWVACPDILHRS